MVPGSCAAGRCRISSPAPAARRERSPERRRRARPIWSLPSTVSATVTPNEMPGSVGARSAGPLSPAPEQTSPQRPADLGRPRRLNATICGGGCSPWWCSPPASAPWWPRCPISAGGAGHRGHQPGTGGGRRRSGVGVVPQLRRHLPALLAPIPAPAAREMAWSQMGSGALLPGGGVGSLAVGGWLLHLAGMSTRQIVRRSSGLFFLTSAINVSCSAPAASFCCWASEAALTTCCAPGCRSQ